MHHPSEIGIDDESRPKVTPFNVRVGRMVQLSLDYPDDRSLMLNVYGNYISNFDDSTVFVFHPHMLTEPGEWRLWVQAV